MSAVTVCPALRLLIKHGGDPYPVADAITAYKMNSFIDPEMALCSLNTIARKAETVSRGSVSHACILASEAVRDNAIYRRAVKVYGMMKAGKSVEDAARSLDDERKDCSRGEGFCHPVRIHRTQDRDEIHGNKTAGTPDRCFHEKILGI